MATLKLIVNGQEKQIEAQTIRALVVALGLGEQPVAVEHNRKLVPKRDHEKTPLQDGDSLEVVTLVGGG